MYPGNTQEYPRPRNKLRVQFPLIAKYPHLAQYVGHPCSIAKPLARRFASKPFFIGFYAALEIQLFL